MVDEGEATNIFKNGCVTTDIKKLTKPKKKKV